MSKSSEYTLERVTLSNLDKLIPLYKNAFNLDLPHSFIEGKFRCNANGKDTFAFIAIAADGTTAAYYNVLPYIISYKEKEMLTVQSCVAMTHSEHRGKGLFPLLGKAVHDLARDEGARFIFGFPNPQSYHGLVNKMNFTHADTMKSYRFKVSTLPLGRLLKKIKMQDMYLAFAKSRLHKIEAASQPFVNSVIDTETGGVIRSQNFINYKKYSGCVVTEVEEKKVWLKVDNVINIGDMERADEKTFLQIISKIKSLCVPLGITDIVFNVAPGTYYDSMMAKLNVPFKETLPVLYWEFDSGIDLKKIRFTGADYDTF